MANSNIDIGEIKQYFAEKLDAFGASPRGADWNSQESQYVRFEQLMKVCDPSRPFSIIDYGCGYGELTWELAKTHDVTGVDLNPERVRFAAREYPGTFVSRDHTPRTRIWISTFLSARTAIPMIVISCVSKR